MLRRLSVQAVLLAAGLAIGVSGTASADTFKVTNTKDAGRGSLRSAIQKANKDASADKIKVKAKGTVKLQGVLPDLATDMKIIGPGPSDFKVRRSSGGDYRIFSVPPGPTVSISGLSALNGNVTGATVGGGGIDNEATLVLKNVAVQHNAAAATSDVFAQGDGGGIVNHGVLTLKRSVVSHNTASATASEMAPDAIAAGGGVFSDGTLKVISSTVADNDVTGGGTSFGLVALNGGGIVDGSMASGDTTDIRRSTVSGNTVEGGGASGGIEVRFGATLTVENSTIEGNSAQFAGGLDNQQGAATVDSATIADNSSAQGGANLTNAGGGALTMRNSIVASPSGGAPDCSLFSTFVDQGFDLDSDGSCNLDGPSSQSSADPKLQPLADNGGPTQTSALGIDSDAIDQGDSGELTTDQRGQPRPVNLPGHNAPGGDGADIGAFERGS